MMIGEMRGAGAQGQRVQNGLIQGAVPRSAPTLAILLLVFFLEPTASKRIDVNCAADARVDAALLNNATDESAAGDLIAIHGRCVVRETVRLAPERAYQGDSRWGTVIIQANHSNLASVVASAGVLMNHTYTDNPTTIRSLTIDGNAAVVSGSGGSGNTAVTTGLALRAWFSSVDDVRVMNCGGDGLLLSSAAPRYNDGPNGRIANSWVLNSGGHGVHVDGDTTDWNLINNWISDSGRSGIYLTSAAGWQIAGNHLYSSSEHAIFAEACFATAIDGNYIEDFARNGTQAPTQPPGSGGSAPGPVAARYYGIGCRVQGGAATVISRNRVFRFGTLASKYKQGTEFAYIGVDRVNYGTGQVSVLGNVVRRDNASTADVGLMYEMGDRAGVQLQLLSASNNVQVQPLGTPRQLDSAVTIVTPL